MNRIFLLVFLISFFFVLNTIKSEEEEEEARNTLVGFYQKLSNNNVPLPFMAGWNLTSFPCKDQWKGLVCDNRTLAVRGINLTGFNFAGTFDASNLCNTLSISASLTSIDLSNNSLQGTKLDGIANCKQLTRIYIGGNSFSGNLPESLSRLNNLKVLDISQNKFSGNLPNLSRISGLQELYVQENHLTGPLPEFDLSNFFHFNVSFNNFTGRLPSGARSLSPSSFFNNPELCGDPLPKSCQSLPEETQEDVKNGKGKSTDQIIMFSGYALIVLVIILFIIFKLCTRSKNMEEKVESVKELASVDDSCYKKPSYSSGDQKTDLSKPEVSAVSDSGMVSSSLVLLASPEVNGLKFDDLLRAPAELLGRGKHGTVYKVSCGQGMDVAVKRIRDWGISSNELKKRMQRLDQVKHPNVLPAIAFYCSKQEKLLVYDYQKNGSLFNLLHGNQTGQDFDWCSRLEVAATVSNTLAFMHQELIGDGIPHGNLKSSNILLNSNMEPCITEYGLMAVDNEENKSATPSFTSSSGNVFKQDIYGLGVILLELLTGKQVQNNGMSLAKWVLSVVREEWTVEVFDKKLIREGASEERMVNLLQIAVKCVNGSPESRPSISQVALMINTIRDEEERSMVSET